ncbi:MAG: ROK family protein [Bacteroides sp.]|nr:ROK family protein [Barnesiella sp.]MBD5344088.1 ROK family protein [Bacteroides sp.]MBD5367746.1 ROK family protein [Bacteroides sp.]MDE5828720.1 ROK family protein [Duncaniella sp.]
MNKPYVVGIDIGGTNTVFGIVDARGVVIASSSIKTQQYADVNDYIDELYKAIMRLLEAHNAVDKIHGIGIGAPNANYYTGMIERLVNIPWPTPLPLAKMVSDKFGIPVAITNDANAAAIGEMTYGAARGLKNFIMITLGTGVGSGIVINGQVVYGHDGFAGELGHVIMKRNNGRLCGCGRTGCLEAYCSASGVARTAREFLEIRNDDSKLRDIPLDQITSKDVYDAAIAGDPLAKEIFQFTGNMLGEAFADFTVFSSPEAIILFGGLAKSGELLMKPIRESMERNMFPAFKGKVKILPSELKEADAAILGASALGWEAKFPAAPATQAAVAAPEVKAE